MSTTNPAANSTFQIRRAQPSDLDILVELRLEFLIEVTGEASPTGLRESLQTYFENALQTGDFVGWLAVTDERIVGTSGLVFMHRPPSHHNLSGRDGYIMNMYTLPAWRGRGIGTKLFKEILQYIQNSGSGKAFLHATEDGRKLYEKFGFSTENTEVEMSLKIH